jgi:hypothetical protein
MWLFNLLTLPTLYHIEVSDITLVAGLASKMNS